jgi:hypothetical protein
VASRRRPLADLLICSEIVLCTPRVEPGLLLAAFVVEGFPGYFGASLGRMAVRSSE